MLKGGLGKPILDQVPPEGMNSDTIGGKMSCTKLFLNIFQGFTYML